jgi:hypothetical protein
MRTPIQRKAGQPDVILGYAFQKIFGKRLQVIAKSLQRIPVHTAPEEVWRESVTGGTLALVMGMAGFRYDAEKSISTNDFATPASIV